MRLSRPSTPTPPRNARTHAALTTHKGKGCHVKGFSKMSRASPERVSSKHMTQTAGRRVILGAETPKSAWAARLPWHPSQLSSCLSPPPPPLPRSPSDGLAAFRAFLRTEFSEENLEFWLACEEYKKIKSQSKMASKAKKIFAEYIAIQSCKEVSERLNPLFFPSRFVSPCQ